jgi:Na+/phosphate symporter
MNILTVIVQISLDGFNRAGESGIVNGLLVSLCIILFGVCVFLFKKYEDKVQETNDVRQQSLDREHQRNKDILESEKETLKVLNGVTGVLEFSEKINQQDTNNILKKIEEESDKIQRRIDQLEKDSKSKRK